MKGSTLLNIEEFEIQKKSKLPIFKQLSEFLKNKIITGELSTGDRLPSIRSLSKAVQLSVDTINSSYTDLVEEGLIISRARSGFIVAEVPQIYRDCKPQSVFAQNPPRPLTGKMRRAAAALNRYKLPKQEAKPLSGSYTNLYIASQFALR